jgi:monomeric sarcosine oxidase
VTVESCDVVVLGLGAMGAASLFHLAKAGVRAIGVEPHDIPHALGSSYGSSRVIRKAYFEDARYVPFLERSYALWHALEEESGATLYTKTGCINLGPRDHPDLRSVVGTVTQHALPYELLDAAAIRERFPAFRVDDDVVGVFEEDAGILQPERCTTTHCELAVRHGARIHAHERVIDVRTRAGGVDVVTDKRSIACGHVVVSMGPWLPSTSLAAVQSVSAKMHAIRQMQLWFAPPNATFAHGMFPVFIQFGRPERSEGTYYGMPPHQGNGVKVCRHGGGVTTTPDTIDRDVRDTDVEDVRGYMRRSLPALAEEPLTRSAVCMYTMTPDANFVVGRVDERATILGGFSGHGFKMASVIGEIASELATKGKTTLDISLFDPARLSAPL